MNIFGLRVFEVDAVKIHGAGVDTLSDQLPPDLPDAIDFIEPGDLVSYTAPNGRGFTAKVVSRDYDESIAHEDGTWGVWLITIQLWYIREDGLPGIMRRRVPETSLKLQYKSNAL